MPDPTHKPREERWRDLLPEERAVLEAGFDYRDRVYDNYMAKEEELLAAADALPEEPDDGG